MTKVTGPLFKWFGSKWLSSKTLPAPAYGILEEPFAGGAGYSLRHHEKQVVLCEKNPHVAALWRWLIGEATEDLVRSIPIGVAEGTDIRTLGLSDGQALLLKTWQRTNNVGDCWTISPWGNKPGQWTANTRARVAEQIQAVKHWKFAEEDGMHRLRMAYEGPWGATWFIDPPYQYNYQYRGDLVNYQVLACLIWSLKGQRIVCEAACQKTGAVPAWLPFVPFGSRITSRRKTGNNHHSSELIWSTM
jgi:hypothetical protein